MMNRQTQNKISDGQQDQAENQEKGYKVDTRRTTQLRAYQNLMDSGTPIQRRENRTGLPDTLKSGIEHLSHYSMDDVQVHYNSPKPAQLQAHAYAQGNQIHLGPGQERHLPHEAWHVVQQKQGRVQPTRQFKGITAINDDKALEHEADVMGARAMRVAEPAPSSAKIHESRNNEVIQRVAREDVVDFFARMRDAQPARLNLYTHVMADGIGDAGLVGHLHGALQGEMGAYGIQNLETYLAVEKKVNVDDLDEVEGAQDFAENNQYINQTFPQYQQLVLDLAHTQANHAVWAASTNPNIPNKEEGREASQIDDNNWEIQYPVPVDDEEVGNQKLKIKEMGVNVMVNAAKTGEIANGIGYGIPALNPDRNVDEQAIMERAAQEGCDLGHAWLASIKEFKGSAQDPLPNVLRSARTYGGDNTLVYLPGGIGAQIDQLQDFQVQQVLQQGGLTLSEVTLPQAAGTVYAVTGNFRNRFMHFCMNSINDGVILSGGEGLYAESLATTEAQTAPVMAPRYNYQYEEVARAIATNQGPLQTVTVDRYDDNSIAFNPIIRNYGVVKIAGQEHTFTYNADSNKLRAIYGVNFIDVVNEPGNRQVTGQVQIQYSANLSSLYFPLSLNSNRFTHVPQNFNFQTAKQLYVAERDRLRDNHNWFGIIRDVAHPPQQAQQADQAQRECCSDCYITTACVMSKGLPDDCNELSTLRSLRDEYILSKENGPKLVKMYYETAPDIVHRIDQLENAREYYERLYRIIDRCVSLVKIGETEEAFQIYCNMVLLLDVVFLKKQNPETHQVKNNLKHALYHQLIKNN